MLKRPESFDEFLGQERVKKLLKVAVESAKKRREVLDHVLFYGPPGTGKTTLAGVLAKELEREIKVVSAPMIEKKGDIVALLTSLKEGDILFIDEVHRLNRAIEETLYTAMEDFRIDIVAGFGKGKAISIEIPKFTLVGATTRLNLLTPPFRSRFGIVCRLELYSVEELKVIAKRNFEKLSLEVSEKGLERLAKSCRGTPRILNQLIKRVRDYAVVHGWKLVNEEQVDFILKELGIDEHGLDPLDRKILEVIATVFKGGPVGINTLAAVLKEDVDTIENVHEPFLVERGFLVKTSKGRKLTRKGFSVIGLLQFTNKRTNLLNLS